MPDQHSPQERRWKRVRLTDVEADRLQGVLIHEPTGRAETYVPLSEYQAALQDREAEMEKERDELHTDNVGEEEIRQHYRHEIEGVERRAEDAERRANRAEAVLRETKVEFEKRAEKAKVFVAADFREMPAGPLPDEFVRVPGGSTTQAMKRLQAVVTALQKEVSELEGGPGCEMSPDGWVEHDLALDSAKHLLHLADPDNFPDCKPPAPCSDRSVPAESEGEQ
jgi:hypothetical protein